MSAKSKKKYLCIHGHFYQPPRENPWLEALQVQDSAYPDHDWNERVFKECYAPNAFARITDAKGSILRIMNNYEWISFNFGPTLLDWMEKFNPEIYGRIIESDHRSIKFFSGHGNALAQNYNHIIMPLALREDKVAQVVWGIKDFEKRFSRKPEGMWLAETAVDIETLQILQEHGIKFTILSPYQAKSIRKIPQAVNPKDKSSLEWHDVSGGRIDSTRPYLVRLPNHETISIFFYQGDISKAIAFDQILSNSDAFISKLLSGFHSNFDEVQLLHVATDGESYGHHKKFGDMTLAYSIYELLQRDDVELINYGSFLEKYPAQYEAEIFENSSWSCAHGVERWRSDCGCTTSSQPGWTQKWRAPLREGLDFLRDHVLTLYQERMQLFCLDPTDVFHQYFHVVHHDETVLNFIEKYQKRTLTEKERIEFFNLLEMRRNANLMYTSCGWFFSEISGIETVQILAYAGRVVQLLLEFDLNLEESFLTILRQAISNMPDLKNGEVIYRKFVKPLFVDLKKIAIHFAITSLFEDYHDMNTLYAYEVECLDLVKESRGINLFCFGNIVVTCMRTTQKQAFQFAVLHYGETDFHCAIEGFTSKETYFAKKEKILKTFRNEHLTELVQLLTFEFSKEYFTLSHVFVEEKRKILNLVLRGEVDRLNQLIFYMAQKNKKIVEYCFKESIPIPKPLLMFNEYTYQKVVEHLFSGVFGGQDLYQQLSQIMHIIQVLGFKLDLEEQLDIIQSYLEKSADHYFSNPNSLHDLNEFLYVLKATKLLSDMISFWNLENRWYHFFSSHLMSVFKSDTVNASKIKELLNEVKVILRIGVEG